jgi:hypothetical protein
MLSLYQSPVNCRNREFEGNCAQGIAITVVISGPEMYIPTLYVGGLAFSRTRKWLNSQNSLLLGKL